VGTRCANHVTPLYPQKLALTSPTGGGRSVGMVRSRTKATEFLSSELGSSVSIVTRRRAGRPGNRGSIPGWDKICFISPNRPDRFPPVSCLFDIVCTFSLEVKRVGAEA